MKKGKENKQTNKLQENLQETPNNIRSNTCGIS